MGFNRKKGISSVVVLAVLGVFNAIAFLAPFKHILTFWMGYGFVTLSALILLASFLFLFNADDKEQLFLRLPIIKLAWGYLVVQTIVGILEIAGVLMAYLPALVINSCLAGFYIIAILASQAAGETIEKQDAKVAEKVYFIKNMQALLSGVKTDDSEIAAKINELSEDFKYSDPMSHSALKDIENQIEIEVITLQSKISNKENALTSIEGIFDLLKERNTKCKLFKNVKEPKEVSDNSGVKYAGTTIGIFALIAAIVLIVLFVIIPKDKYNDGMTLYNEKKFEEAISVFKSLDGFSDSEKMIDNCKSEIKECDYKKAESLFSNQEYIGAVKLYANLDNYKDSKQKIEQIENRLDGEDALYYGTYKNNPITWKVLETKDDKMLLITKNAICELPYNNEIKNVNWKDSSLNKWLNDEFLKSFSEEQMVDIIATEVDGTNSKVFLLNDNQVKNIKDKELLQSDKDWWLCTRAKTDANALFVSKSGEISKGGDEVVRSRGVRPCIWIDLK